MNHAFVAALAEACETSESLAGRIGIHPKTVARWANPGRIPQTRHRAEIAKILGKDVAELWPDALRREPVWFRPWVDIEREAVALRAFQLAWVPGLLQTEAYARATFHGQPLSPAEVDDLVGARIDRQAILTCDRAPMTVVVIDEQVIRRAAAGERAIMTAQLAHLVTCAELPTVQLHIVPRDAPTYPGLDGPFTIAELPGGARVAHVDSQAQAHIIDQASQLATLERRWERIRGEALSRSQSLDLLREAAAAWT
ncbi:Scr1 family TA system antitoxin-like transcriptional regulator [Micromonospora sp. NBC_01412]|uniref:Scr1 family TA system antitoxin-like transcriptional regulator n=1 Tax=Micromonospora sp. NBC_01412 TaxID=2903590 RepID=UPI003255998B